MIFEIATIDVNVGEESAFEAGVSKAIPIFRRAHGFRSIRLERSIETRLRYHLVVGWETLEDHIVRFRNSEDFQRWRDLVGHTFAAPPMVEHTAIVLGDDLLPAAEKMSSQ